MIHIISYNLYGSNTRVFSWYLLWYAPYHLYRNHESRVFRNHHSTNRFIFGTYRLGQKFFKARTTGKNSRFWSAKFENFNDLGRPTGSLILWKYQIDTTQELVAFGSSQVVNSMIFGVIPTTSVVSRTTVMYSAGKSMLATWLTAGTVCTRIYCAINMQYEIFNSATFERPCVDSNNISLRMVSKIEKIIHGNDILKFKRLRKSNLRFIRLHSSSCFGWCCYRCCCAIV